MWAAEREFRSFLLPVGRNAENEGFLRIYLALEVGFRQRVALPLGFAGL